MSSILQTRHARIPYGAFATAAGLTILYLFAPSRYSFYPRCPFFALTHLLCPGCGGTRALYDLLHLNLAGALHYNALVTALTPVVLAWMGWGWVRVWRYHVSFPAVPWPRTTAAVLGTVAILFAVIRDAGIAFVM